MWVGRHFGAGGAALRGGWGCGGYAAVSPRHPAQSLSAVATPTSSPTGPLPSPAPDPATFQSPYTRQDARRWQPTVLESARGHAALQLAEKEVRVPPGSGLPPRSEQNIERKATGRAPWKRGLPSRRHFRHAEEYKLGCAGPCFHVPVRQRRSHRARQRHGLSTSCERCDPKQNTAERGGFNTKNGGRTFVARIHTMGSHIKDL